MVNDYSNYSMKVHQGLSTKSVTPEKNNTDKSALLADNTSEKETTQQEQPTFAVSGWDVQANQYKAGLDVKLNRDAWIESITSKYNTPEQQERIEASMVEFVDGTSSIANIIGAEFPTMSESTRNALAAGILATHQG